MSLDTGLLAVFASKTHFRKGSKRNAQLVLIPDEWKEKFLARIETWETETSHEKQQKIDCLKSELTSLKAKIDRINNGFAEGSIDIAEFKELKNPLVPQKAALEEQIAVLERSKANRLTSSANFSWRAKLGEYAVIKWIGKQRLVNFQFAPPMFCAFVRVKSAHKRIYMTASLPSSSAARARWPWDFYSTKFPISADRAKKTDRKNPAIRNNFLTP